VEVDVTQEVMQHEPAVEVDVTQEVFAPVWDEDELEFVDREDDEADPAQLPERLDYVRGGYFVYNDHDNSYTSKQYQQIYVFPKSFADRCLWTFSLEGGTLNEKLCTTTYFSSECNGWLATECGPCALQ
jgi:hypothetical protein